VAGASTIAAVRVGVRTGGLGSEVMVPRGASPPPQID
jgi:hypothetical protein